MCQAGWRRSDGSAWRRGLLFQHRESTRPLIVMADSDLWHAQVRNAARHTPLPCLARSLSPCPDRPHHAQAQSSRRGVSPYADSHRRGSCTSCHAWDTSRRPCLPAGVFMHTLASMALSAGAMLTYTVLVVLGRKPWWDAQYVIPILGMILVGQGGAGDC